MPGPLPKDPDRRQRRNAHGLGLVVDRDRGKSPGTANSGGIPVPLTDKAWLAVTKKAWTELWESDLAKAYNATTDLPGLRRLFGMRDDRERYRRAVQKDPLVEGSQGQPVKNPLAVLIGPLDGELRQMEDRYGLSPASRLKLGIKLGEAARSLDDLNRGVFADQADEEDEGEDGSDPRLGAINTRAH